MWLELHSSYKCICDCSQVVEKWLMGMTLEKFFSDRVNRETISHN